MTTSQSSFQEFRFNAPTSTSTSSKELTESWDNSPLLPIIFSALSFIWLISQSIFLSKPAQRLYSHVFPPSEQDIQDSERAEREEPQPPQHQSIVSTLGGQTIFALMLARLIGCVALLVLSVVTFLLNGKYKAISGGVRVGLGLWGDVQSVSEVSRDRWMELLLCLTYAYTSLLATLSLSRTSTGTLSQTATTHLVFLLLLLTATFTTRNLYPLATYDRTPLDLTNDGPFIICAKGVVLFVVAILIPVGVPRRYEPVDVEESNPNYTPNPEQTASLLSLFTFTYLDPIILAALKTPHLSAEQLPVLADYDRAGVLVRRSFMFLDTFSGATKRHIFFGLMRVFRREYAVLMITIIVKVLCDFANPFGINRLLNYLETNGKDAAVKPWLWILWLFVGSVAGSVVFQWYTHVFTVIVVRTEAILTQLVFEHSLRVRMKAESPSSPDVPACPSPSSGAHERDTTNDTLVVSDTDDELLDECSLTARRFSQASAGAATPASPSSGKRKATTQEQQPNKDKDKIKNQEGGEEGTESSPSSMADHLVGRINNLVTTDIATIVDGADFVALVVQVPLQIAISIVFLYKVLGWSAFVGLAAMIVSLPFPVFVGRLIQNVQISVMQKTDARVDTLTETMNVLRMVKMFGWERKMNERVAEKREEELKWVWKRNVLALLTSYANNIIPLLTMILTFVVYTVVMKETLSASKVFSSMSVFDMLRTQLHECSTTFKRVIQGKVSLDRINTFIKDTELLDAFSEQGADVKESTVDDKDKIGFRSASFTWSLETESSQKSSKRGFVLRVEEELVFKRGCINLVVGPTGSGKTSLLMALLGEMHFVPSGPTSWCNLPRAGGVAYVAQESWVQNETIRDNILFGSPYDNVRYDKVIHQCGLERDLGLFDAGDYTEVGEKGLTLSGGQKARITLARAIYSHAEILLLDDVFAALDVHTAKWIIEQCFRGDLLSGRTVILVTNNVLLARPIAEFVVSIGLDGNVTGQGSVSEVLYSDDTLVAEVAPEEHEAEKAEPQIDATKVEVKDSSPEGKLIVAEEVEEGRVSWSALNLLLSHMSGRYSYLFWTVFLGGIIFYDVAQIVQLWFLGVWASQYDTHDPADVAVSYYLTVYALLLCACIIAYCLAYIVYYMGSFRASKKIHQELVESITGTTLRWLDTTPTSRIIARCTQDMRAVDTTIPDFLGFVVELSVSIVAKIGAVVAVSPIFAIPSGCVAFLGVMCGRLYMRAQLSVKREMSNARAPVVAHFGAAIPGLVSIRAYGAQGAFRDESLIRINKYTRTARNFWDLNRWVAIRIDALGSIFAASLEIYLVYGRNNVNASNTGFSLVLAIQISTMILHWVRLLNALEVSGNSLERIQGYISIEQEPKSTDSGVPPAYWPASGDLQVESMSARYSPNGPKVLQDISFHIRSGERVGVAGRTGSGKSSLTLSLLRCINIEGEVYYAGLPIGSLNLDALRTNITIIPQIPELLSGTLRANLDPFSEHDDATLNDALRAAGLFSLQSEMDQGRITLDTAISNAGGNLSIGQRQIIALARAIVRQSKLLILDEATSAIDYETDSVIQSSLRQDLGRDVTVITVAHRLQTIMDADKIMVLDAGRIVEFDTPKELLKNEKGLLRALVDESGDKDKLYSLASARSE